MSVSETSPAELLDTPAPRPPRRRREVAALAHALHRKLAAVETAKAKVAEIEAEAKKIKAELSRWMDANVPGVAEELRREPTAAPEEPAP
jgi:hypothetical protein